MKLSKELLDNKQLEDCISNYYGMAYYQMIMLAKERNIDTTDFETMWDCQSALGYDDFIKNEIK